MATTPWMTSDQLIESVKRKISMPVSQGTLTAEDILAFATEELMISQVPSVLQFHEEFFVWNEDRALVANKKRYEIPDRAIGMKLRDLFYKDSNDTLFEMTRVSADNKSNYQSFHEYYLEGNDVVLTVDSIEAPTGSLNFSYFLRPNSLVPNERAAIITSFFKNVTVDNATIVAGDTVTVDGTDYEAVAGGPTGNQFLIAGSSAATATNLAAAITSSGTTSTSSSAQVSIFYSDVELVVSVTSSAAGLTLAAAQGIEFDTVPDNIADLSVVDFLQTKGGHSMRAYGITVPANGVSGDTVMFDSDDVPTTLVVGDYVCTEHESIIPQIPSDLHSGLAERTCARILAAIGDQQGLAASNQKIAEIEQRTGTLVDNRVEGSLKKIVNRNSILLAGKSSYRRRW